MTTALASFFLSSGGSGALDLFARSGVGDQLVAAQEDAMSFGPIESELFLESEMPSLYDVVDEFYNEPAKFKRQAKVRAIPPSPSTTQESRRRMATTKQAGRAFTLIRQPAPTRKEQRDRSTHALFSVAGRVPLHLKLATYNRWDGHKLPYESPAATIEALGTEVDDSGRNWASLGDSHASDLFPTVERHALRFLNLKTKRVPTPAHLSRLHVDQMRDARLFDRTADGGFDYGGAMIDALRSSLNRVLQGKNDVVEAVLACLLARGCLLFDDLPGLGKTTLAKALAHAVGRRFARVQCTPDLLPSDVTGFSVFNQKNGSLSLTKAPCFATCC